MTSDRDLRAAAEHVIEADSAYEADLRSAATSDDTRRSLLRLDEASVEFEKLVTPEVVRSLLDRLEAAERARDLAQEACAGMGENGVHFFEMLAERDAAIRDLQDLKAKHGL